MKTTFFIQALILMAILLQQAYPGAAHSAALAKPVALTAAQDEDTNAADEIDTTGSWLVTDEESRWTNDEVEFMQRVRQNTFVSLEAEGVDGMALLDGYRFRHQAARYLDGIDGFMAKIDHNVQEITLSDMAFTVLDGFTIYHELGHAVDYRTNRQMSAGFHRMAGSKTVAGEGEVRWETADDYWLRLPGRDDPEEAAADAFAVLVMAHAGLRLPVFPNEPVTTDYDGIAATLAQALKDS